MCQDTGRSLPHLTDWAEAQIYIHRALPEEQSHVARGYHLVFIVSSAEHGALGNSYRRILCPIP